MAAFAGGLVALILGIIGIIVWWGYFIKALLAGIPIMLILGGALAAYLGFEEIRDKRKADEFSQSNEGLKNEADSLKEEAKELDKDSAVSGEEKNQE